MKQILAVLAFFSIAALCASPARSATLADVCNRLRDGRNILHCVEAANGRYTDPKALDLCNRFSQGENIIRCVSTVAGRSYQTSDVDLCAQFRDGENLLSCMASAGRPYECERGGREMMRDLVSACKARFSNDSDRLSCVEAGIRP